MRRTTGNHFSTARTWDQIRVRGPEVSGHLLVWFTQGVSHHAFIFGWHSRIYYPQEFICGNGKLHKVVCSVESGKKAGTTCFRLSYHIHYLDYSNSYFLGASASPYWTFTVTSILRRNQNKLDVILWRLVFHSTLYLVWKECNPRRHHGPWLIT